MKTSVCLKLSQRAFFAFILTTSCVSFADAHHSSLTTEFQSEQISDSQENSPAIILQPSSTERPQRLLIIFPGMYRSPSEYENLARELQKASPFSLWVGIIRFTGNLDNPPQASSSVDFIFDQVRARGFTEAAPERTTIAGHSLGGIIAQYYVNKKNYAGLILMSSYLVRTDGNSSLPQASLPVFTLSGELDGQTRITRVAIDAKSLLTLPAQVSKKPVIVLPKVNHSQFAGTETAKSDLKPEIAYTEAQKQIAQMMSDFMVVNDASDHDAGDRQPSTQRLLSAVRTTRELLTPYWEAQMKDQSWCEEAQKHEAEAFAGSYQIRIKHEIYNSELKFAQSKPQAALIPNVGIQLNISSMLKYHPNVMDRSTIPEAAQTLACKTKSSDALTELTGIQHSSSSSCRDLNSKAYHWALSKLGPEARERYLRRGRALNFAEDRSVASGLQWLPAPLSFQNDDTARSTTVISTRLSTGTGAPFGLAGMNYCKLLSPTRAMEWMMVDSLRD